MSVQRQSESRLRFGAVLVLGLVLAGCLAWLPQAEADAAYLRGRAVQCTASRTDTVRNMAQRDAAARSQARAALRPAGGGVAVPFRPAPLPGEAGTGDQGFFSAPQSGRRPRLNGAQTIAAHFAGVEMGDEPSLNGGFVMIPPDTNGCVGPNHFVEVVNGAVGIYSKTGTVASMVSLDSFFFVNASVPGGSAPKTTDPHVIYDRRSGHWIAVVIDKLSTDNNAILAISRTNDPTGTWDKYSWDAGTGGVFADYCTLGIDDNGIYVGFNNFGPSFRTKVWATPKAAALSALGAAITITDLNPSGFTDMVTPQPAYNFDPVSATGRAWVIGSFSFNGFTLRSITWTGSTPAITASAQVLGVAIFSNPVAPGVPNGIASPDAGDTRLLASVIRNGRLWAAHHIGCDSTGANGTIDRDAAAWFEADVSTALPSLVQEGRIFDTAATNPRSYYYPTICPSGQGHAAMGFSGSSANTNDFIGVYVSGRLQADTSGTMQSIDQVKAGEANYNLQFGGGRNRWGDYSYTSLDPNDDMTLWTIQEYAKTPPFNFGGTDIGRWATRIVKLSAPAPTLNNPGGSGAQGQTGVTLNLTGTGLYDPGVGFTRPTATLSGTGIINYNLTVNSATSATLTFDISGAATLGSRDLTFTNPDGQSVTVTGAFTVVGLLAPTNLVATVLSATQIQLDFDDNSSTEDNFRLERKTGAGAFTEVQILPANATASVTYTDVFLTPNTQYQYRVRAFKSPSTFSAYTNNSATVTTFAVPNAPTGLTAKAASNTSIVLTWQDNSTFESLYQVERKVHGSASPFVVVKNLAGTPTTGPFTVTDTGLTTSTFYDYQVRAKSGTAFSAYSNGATAQPLPLPNPPSGLLATATSATSILLTWTDNSNNEAGFYLERKKPTDPSWTRIKTLGINVVQVNDTGLTTDQPYSYRLQAFNGSPAAGIVVSAFSNVSTATPVSPPNAPTALTVQALSSTSVKLKWQDNSTNETGWSIERRIGLAGTWSVIHTLAGTPGTNQVSYTDPTAASGTTYYYRVRAANGTVFSTFANSGPVTTP